MNDEQPIRKLLLRFRNALRKGEISRLLEMVTDEVLIVAAGRAPVRGRDDLRAHLSGLVDTYRLDLSGNTRQIRISDGVAYCWAQLLLRALPHDGGPTVVQSGPTLLIFERQPDGGWLLARQANLIQFAA
jgi:uncharacterized protein (TIGR02246 family)